MFSEKAKDLPSREAVMLTGLIGENISGSLSPVLHEAEGRAHKLDYSYHLIDPVQGDYQGSSLSEMLDTASAIGMVGVNITHPFKKKVLGFLDLFDPIAEQVGAVNTVVFDAGKRHGFNTDYSGYKRSIELFETELDCSKVMMIGAGGAGAAVALALIDSGTTTLGLLDIDTKAAHALAVRISALRPSASVVVCRAPSEGTWDGLVNCSPVGMRGHPGMPVDPSCVRGLSWVNDIVYVPMITPLLSKAVENGLACLPGTGMVVGQAADSFRLFTGHDADHERMLRTLWDSNLKVLVQP